MSETNPDLTTKAEALEALRAASGRYARLIAALSEATSTRESHPERVAMVRAVFDTAVEGELAGDIDNGVMAALNAGVRFTEADVANAGRAVKPADGDANGDELLAALSAAERCAMELDAQLDLANMLAMKLENEDEYSELNGLFDKVRDTRSVLTALTGVRREAMLHVEIFAEAGYHAGNAD